MIVVIFFFVICRCGFFVSDDWSMGIGLTSFREVVAATIGFYNHWGGGVFSAFCQYLFCGLWDGNKLWFDLVNTLMFLLTVLLCGKLIGTGKKAFWPFVLLFSLLFWFLVPVPNETLFWPVGSIGYMWISVLNLVFLWMVERHKKDELPVWENLALLVLSIVCMISVSGIVAGGLLMLYYLFHRKELSNTGWCMIAGCIIGGLIGTLAPGNFARAGTGGEFSLVSYLVRSFSPLSVMHALLNYRAMWLLVVCLALLFVITRDMAKEWCRNHIVLLLVLAGGVFVNSTVFAPYISSNRTLYFSEVLSIVLLLGMIYYLIDESTLVSSNLSSIVQRMCMIVAVLLFGFFVVDGIGAVANTKQLCSYNEECLNEIRLSNGVVALDLAPEAHRMAMSPMYPNWSWEGIACKLELDSVHVYPYYCLDKYFEPPLCYADNVYVDKIGVYDSQGMVVIRCPETDSLHGFVCQIDYERPRKWYWAWIDRIRLYEYGRSVEVDCSEPEICYQGYCYYVIWMSTENCRNIKRIEMIEGK